MSARSGASAGRNGRSASFGCARAVIGRRPRRRGELRKPLPLRERVSEGAARSSFHLPSRGPALVVLELDPHRLELVADAVGFLETFRLARAFTCIHERVHFICIDNTPMRMLFERFY